MKNMRVLQLAATFIFFVRIHLYISFSVLLAISECDFSCAFVRFLASRAEITLIALLPQLSVCLFRVTLANVAMLLKSTTIFKRFLPHRRSVLAAVDWCALCLSTRLSVGCQDVAGSG